MDKNKIIKILIIITVLALIWALGTLSRLNRETIYANNSIEENVIEPEFMTFYVWNDKSLKTFKNYYYVDLGVESEPITQYYAELRVAMNEGDLEEGNYRFMTNQKPGASFLIYVVDEPIENLYTYDGHYEDVYDKPIELELKKGQYVYIVQGFNDNGSISLAKID